MSFSRLPLQDMIANVVKTASERLADGEDIQQEDVVQEAGQHDAVEGDSDLTEPEYVEKLASAVDVIAANTDNIAPPNRGVLGQALDKMAGEPMPPEASSAGALDVTAGPGGTQKYKKDKPKGEDAAKSQADAPTQSAGLPGGKTQVQNDMNSAPGQNSGSVPQKTYPTDGPLHSGPRTSNESALGKEAGKVDALKRGGKRYLELMRGGKKAPGLPKVKQRLNDAGEWTTETVTKPGKVPAGERAKSVATQAGTAGAVGGAGYAAAGGKDKAAAPYGEAQKQEHQRISRGQGRLGGTLGGLTGGIMGASGGGSGKAKLLKGLAGALTGGAAGYGTGYGLSRGSNRVMRAIGGKGKEAAAARETILRKLAGEDVMKSNISSSRSHGPLVGEGEMDAYEAEQVPKNPTDGSGYGNAQRKHVKSNQGAISMTKADAKKPQARQLKEVLDEPAFSPAHDSKLREQLRNSGKAGVKIAGAQLRAFLKQAAAEGKLNQETVDQYKEAMFTGGAGGGGDYGGGAPTPPDPSGGKMAGEGEEDPKAQKLKALIAEQKAKKSMGAMPEGY